MSERSLRIILGLLVVALVAFGVRQWLRRAPGSGDLAAIGTLLGRLDGRDIVRFEVTRGSERYDLARTAQGWQVNGLRADTVVIDRLWIDLTGTVPLEVAARNPANHGRLGVADDSTTTLVFVHADSSRTRLLVGRPGPEQAGGYVRIPGSDEVYLVRGAFFEAMRQPLVYWRDLTVLAVDTATVMAVQLRYADDTFVLRREAAGWTIDGQPADADAVDDLLMSLGRQYAVGFSRDSTGYGSDRRGLVALDVRGDTLVALAMRLGQRGEPLVTLRGNPFIFELDRRSLERLLPPRERLRPGPASPGRRPDPRRAARPSIAQR